MKKITLFFVSLAVVATSFGQVVMKPLWEFSVKKNNLGTAVNDVKNGIAISPDGTKLYLSTRAADSQQVAVYNAQTGVREGYLPDLSGFASNYGGDVSVDANGAIYACNVIISAAGALKIAKWDSPTDAAPEIFINTTAHGGDNTMRVGYGMDVRIGSDGNGFIIMHKNATADFLIWTIVNNVPVSQNPVKVTATGSAITDSYARISIIDDTHFWVDGNVSLPAFCTLTFSTEEPPQISAQRIATRSDINVGVGGATEFTLDGKRYGIFAINNHSTAAAYQPTHHSLVQQLAATGVATSGPVLDKFPDLGLGGTTDATHFVEAVTYSGGTDAYVYLLGGINGIAAFKTAPAKTFSVTVPDGTEKVYIAGSFPGKEWKINAADAPYQLTKSTATPNLFSGIFEASDAIEYKYLCNTDDWEYQEAISVDPLTESPNHAYNPNDVVTYWKAMPKLKFNVTINAASGVPSNLYLKGSWDGWATPLALTASSTPLTAPGIHRAPMAVSYTGSIGNGTTDLYYSNTEYKYYTNDPTADNWEADPDGTGLDNNRKSISPLMNDEIARFITAITTGTNTTKEVEVRIMRTGTGINVVFEGNADVELYGINGMMLDKRNAAGSYSKDLQSGVYVIKVNGKSIKFVR